MDEGTVEIDFDGPVCTLTLDDQPHRNALSPGMMERLLLAYEQIERSHSRVAVLRGRGSAFCAGADIGPLSRVDGPAEAHAYLRHFRAVYQGLRDLSCPTICVVQGMALGAGTELCLAADLVVASTAAHFALPESRLGAVPGFAMVELPHVVGRHRALDLMLTGRSIDATTAHEWGLVGYLAEPQLLEETVAGLVTYFSSAATLAMSTIKRAVAQQTPGYAWDTFVTAAALNLTSTDRRRGTAAFLDKEKPVFDGF